MSIAQLYSENGCSKFRLHIFTDASEKAMHIVAYLQDERILSLTYVVGNYRSTHQRHDNTEVRTPGRS